MSKIATVRSAGVRGTTGYEINVTVELDRTRIASWTVVGLPDASIRESRQRVQAATINQGFGWPRGAIRVLIEPADVRHDVCALDLPIALALLQASEQGQALPVGALAVGELSLSGEIRPVRGILPRLLDVPHGLALVPASNMPVRVGLYCRAVQTLREAATGPFEPRAQRALSDVPRRDTTVDMRYIRGQDVAKAALEDAAVSGASVLLIGPPGTGKTLLARALHGILPPLDAAEELEVARIHSAAGLLGSAAYVSGRPFRAPHHTASTTALVGGGASVRPGEFSLAHGGVLFMDELPEFARVAAMALGHVMRDRRVTIAAGQGTVTMPARFQLVATANPCPCGYHGAPASGRECGCSDDMVARYQSRIDRSLFDVVITCPAVRQADLLAAPDGETSADIAERVAVRRAALGGAR